MWRRQAQGCCGGGGWDYGTVAKDIVEGNDKMQEYESNLTRNTNQDLEKPIYYVGLVIVKPHVILCT